MKKTIKCPICSKNNAKKFLESQGVKVYECEVCSLRFAYPPPTIKELKKYYQKGYFEGGKEGARGYKDYVSLENNLQKEAFLKINLIKKKIKSGKLLDIGAGTGVFAAEAKKAGFLVAANDISPFAVKALKKRKINCILGPVSKKIFQKESFDVVTAWDVIEHVNEIDVMVEAVSLALKKNGYFYLTTPDTGSWDALIMGKNWYGYKKIPEHLLFFNKKSIGGLLGRWGFNVVEMKRWGFYRDLGFVVEKLREYDRSFSFAQGLLKSLSLEKASLFLPLTDFLVVAQKKG